jgi:hypothetical protein
VRCVARDVKARILFAEYVGNRHCESGPIMSNGQSRWRALAVRAAILAANGYDDGARNDARLVSAKPLLPEERALIAPLLQ